MKSLTQLVSMQIEVVFEFGTRNVSKCVVSTLTLDKSVIISVENAKSSQNSIRLAMNE